MSSQQFPANDPKTLNLEDVVGAAEIFTDKHQTQSGKEKKDFHRTISERFCRFFPKIHAKLKPVAGCFRLYPPAKSSLNCFLTERLSVPEEPETVTFSGLRLPICSINSQFLLGKQAPPSGI